MDQSSYYRFACSALLVTAQQPILRRHILRKILTLKLLGADAPRPTTHLRITKLSVSVVALIRINPAPTLRQTDQSIIPGSENLLVICTKPTHRVNNAYNK